MKFYKIRAFGLLFLTRLLGSILFVEVPPIFSVAAIIEKEGKILLIDHTYIKGYGLPGGMVKSGEDLEEAMHREVKEETGLEITNLKYLFSTHAMFKGIPVISATFLVQALGIEKASTEGELIWLNPNEALGKMAYPGTEVTIKKYLKRVS